MICIICCAGDGTRTRGFNPDINHPDTPKPFIKLKNGKTIIETTLSSLPFFNDPTIHKYFAIRSDNPRYNQNCEYLKSLYGNNINIIPISNLTRGNLDTSLIVATQIDNIQTDLLILDSDNLYNNNYLEFSINKLRLYPNNPFLITYFEPQDDSNKWCFAQLENYHTQNVKKVLRIAEKDEWLRKNGGKCLAGTFWFPSLNLFKELAERIIHDDIKYDKNEFYLSSVPRYYMEHGGLLFAHEIKNMVNLGDISSLMAYEQNL